MNKEQLDALSKVHEKWEKKPGYYKQGPDAASSRQSSKSHVKQNNKKNISNNNLARKTSNYNNNNNENNGDIEVESVEDLIEQGKQRWKEKYEKLAFAPKQSKKKSQAKIDTLNIDSIANFKVSPIIKAESLVSYCTYMGFCCPCFPQSRRDLTSENLSQVSLQNVLDAKSELRNPSRLEETFPCLTYSLQRRTFHQYPDVTLRVLISSRVQDAVQQYAESTFSTIPEAVQCSLEKVVKDESDRAKHIFKNMKACISNKVIRFVGWSLFKILGLILRSVQVHRSQLQLIESLEKKSIPIIYLPLHKSHLDYVIITWIMWIHNMRVPHVAAGNNLNIPLLGSVLRALGGFFIRRKLDQNGRKDLVYRAVLQSYMQELLLEGQSLEFFVEGGRSRSGKALYPKGGLLSVVVDAYLQGKIQDAYIVPISISYEKLVEGDFTAEQMGSPKQRENIWCTLCALLQVLCGDYGHVRVEFPQPFSAKEFIQSFNFNNSVALQASLTVPPMPDGTMTPSSLSSSLSSNTSLCTLNVNKENRELVQSLAEHVIYSCVCSTVMMSTNLLAFLLLTKHREGADLNTLSASFKDLINQVRIRNRDIGFSGKTENIIPYAATLLSDKFVRRLHTKDGELFFKPVVDLPAVFGLSYYSAPVTCVFAMESIIVGACFYIGQFGLTDLNSSIHRLDTYIKREELFQTARVLCKLFKFEYILSLNCMEIDDVITDAYDVLVMREILQIPTLEVSNRLYPRKVLDIYSLGDEEDFAYTNERLMINTSSDECIEKLYFYQRIMLPLCEAYLVAANHVKTLFERNIPEDEFISTLHSAAKDRVAKKLVKCSESAALDTLKNAMKALHDFQLITSFHPDGDKDQTKLICLNNENNVKQRLFDLIDLLEHMRE